MKYRRKSRDIYGPVSRVDTPPEWYGPAMRWPRPSSARAGSFAPVHFKAWNMNVNVAFKGERLNIYQFKYEFIRNRL